jgi:Tfp pilus assembly protein PilF
MGRTSVFILAFLIFLSACASGRMDPYNRAVEDFSMGRVSESVEAYKQAIVLKPSDPRPKFNLAVIYQDEGKLVEAERLYREIAEQDTGFAPAWSNLAAIQEKRGQADEAEKSHRRALEADREGCAAACQFGYFLLRADRKDEAGAVFEQSINKDPRCANAWFGLGLLAEGKGDYRTALRNYDRTLIYNPSDLEACLRSANIMISRGDTVHAVDMLQKAASLDPARCDTNILLGKLLCEAGRLKDAEKALLQARNAGAPPAECDRELSIVYGKLCEEATANMAADTGQKPDESSRVLFTDKP